MNLRQTNGRRGKRKKINLIKKSSEKTRRRKAKKPMRPFEWRSKLAVATFRTFGSKEISVMCLK